MTGPLLAENGCLNFEKASRLLLRCACFSGEQDVNAALEEAARRLSFAPSQYEELLSPHVALHQPLFFSAGLTLLDELQEEEKSNEDLMLSAYEEKADNRLLEKLWMFGRYLFISGAEEQSNPFPLYGLWCSGYNMPWCQNVAMRTWR